MQLQRCKTLQISSIVRLQRRSVSAVDGDDPVSRATLMAALCDGPTPVLDRGTLSAVGSQDDPTAWSIHRLEVLLEHAARSAPVLGLR